MVKKVAEFVAEHNMLNKYDKVIAGVSGGADSVCLLFMLLKLQENIGFDIVVVHVNHGLRGEAADRDEKYVEALCRQHNLICEIYREDVELFAKMRKQSLEEAGRNVRREAFQKALAKYSATKIALAHHKNDNVETLLMNLSRGSGLKGLTGMHPVSGNMIRPLLCLERDEIEKFLETENISYCTDETNSSCDYTRNRIRNRIVPILTEEVNEKAVCHMADAMERLRRIWEYMESETVTYYKASVREEKQGLLIEENAYNMIPEVFRGIVIKEALKEVCQKEKDIQQTHITGVERLMEKQSGRKIHLPYHMTARRCYGGVYISCEQKEQSFSPCVEVDFDHTESLRIGDTYISFKTMKTGERKVEKTYTKCFDYDIMKGTIMLRTRRAGDYITIDEDGRRQKLKSYFINEKIPKEEREKVLLLAEGSHVLWVIGYRRGHAYHVGPDTKKILEITINKGEENDGREY